MIFRPACLIVGLAGAAIAVSAESPSVATPVSPVRQYLRDSIKAKVTLKPAETPVTATSEAKPTENPIVMTAFVVAESREKQERRALQIVEGQMQMEERLSYHPLYQNDRIELLRRPRMDDLPTHGGMDRLKFDILSLKW